MFNKIIFKQTFKSNFKIWLIITIALCVMNTVLIGAFNPETITSMNDMVSGTALANILGDSSFIGMLSQTFYSIQGIILLLIYIIITANSLIVSQVDRGSMAYTLSTPVKRTTVVVTQMTYLLTALFTMILITTISGFISIQAFHGGVFGDSYTDDVKAASTVLDIDKEEIADNLNLILENEKAIKEGASARGIDEDAYIAYLNLKINDNAQEGELSEELKEMQDKVILGFAAGAQVLDIEESDMTSTDNLEKIK